MTSNYVLEFLDIHTNQRADRLSPLVPRIGERVRIMEGFYRVKDIDYQFKPDAIWREEFEKDYRPVITVLVIRIPTPEF